MSDKSVSKFMEKAKTIGECLHAYGIHSVTLQPELDPQVIATSRDMSSDAVGSAGPVSQAPRRRRTAQPAECQMICSSSLCENLVCCRLP